MSENQGYAVRKVAAAGRGVFATRRFARGEVVCRDPVLLLDQEDWRRCEATILNDYVYAWPEEGRPRAVSLGIGSLFNAGDAPNVDVEIDVVAKSLTFRAIRPVEPGAGADPGLWRRDGRGALPDPELRLRQRRGADARFAGDEPGFVYSRYGNPTTQMFEDRLALLEGAEACRAHRVGHGAVHLALMGLLRPATTWWPAGRCSAPAAGSSTNGCRASASRPPCRRHRPGGLEGGVRPNTKVFLVESPANPLLEITDIAAVADRARGRRQGGGRQRLRHPDLPEAAAAGRRHRGLFGHQAHRRPGPGAGRRDPGRRGLMTEATATSCATPARRCRRSTPGCC
jgi:hypothetical protein